MSKGKRRFRVKKALLLGLFLPPVFWAAARCMPLLAGLGTQAALVSACLHMPESTVDMLREHFREEIFLQEEEGEAIPPGTQSQPLPPPPSPAPEAPPPQKPKENPNETDKTLPLLQSVPAEYRGELREMLYKADESGIYIPLSSGYLKNSTKLTNSAVLKELKRPLELKLKKTDQPQVLIVHTHATESYENYDVPFYDTRGTWRSTDNEKNVIAVGNCIEKELKTAGIGVVHDVTQHDYPSYNGAYERSAQTVKNYLKKYPTIQVVLDIHRDAIQPKDKLIVKPTLLIQEKKAAQVMIITGCDDGSMNVPAWSSNLRFAAALQSAVESRWEGLMRPVYFCYRKYNMDLTKGSILLEFGSHGNTLEEACYSGELVGHALAQMLLEKQMQKPEK